MIEASEFEGKFFRNFRNSRNSGNSCPGSSSESLRLPETVILFPDVDMSFAKGFMTVVYIAVCLVGTPGNLWIIYKLFRAK